MFQRSQETSHPRGDAPMITGNNSVSVPESFSGPDRQAPEIPGDVLPAIPGDDAPPIRESSIESR